MSSVARQSWIAIAAAAVLAVLIASGLLLVGVAFAAAMRHQTVFELYAGAFPRFRGGAEVAKIPPLAYVIFAGYILTTAELALICRRWINAPPHRRR